MSLLIKLPGFPNIKIATTQYYLLPEITNFYCNFNMERNLLKHHWEEYRYHEK